MTLSDFITFLSIILAIIAIISEKNRSYIALKFSNLDIVITSIILILIHFLLSYSYWINWFPIINSYQISKFPTPNNWAYVLTIILIAFSSFKIFKAKFPYSNRNKLIKFYEYNLYKSEYSLITNLIEKYHKQDIINYLNKRNKIKYPEKSTIWSEYEKVAIKAYDLEINSKSLKFGEIVFTKIIVNSYFIENCSSINPYLFASFVKEMKTKESANEEFVNSFLKQLIKSRNTFLFNEIKESVFLTGINNDTIVLPKNEILFSLLNDANVAYHTRAWKGICEAAIVELNEEIRKSYSILRQREDEKETESVWSFRIKYAVRYINLLVSKSIYQKLNYHMWMYYYPHFTKLLLENNKYFNREGNIDYEYDNSDKTRNYDLIYSIVTNHKEWKTICISERNCILISDIYKCLGQCLEYLIASDSLLRKTKVELLTIVIEDLILTTMDDYEDEKTLDHIFKNGLIMFKLILKNDSSHVINDAWCKRDIFRTDYFSQRTQQFERLFEIN